MNAVDEITAVVERDGAATLPALTQAELCALGAADKSLVCKRTWEWWTGFRDAEREDLAARALGLLAHRGLVVPASGEVPGVPVPELGLILAARTQPEPVVTCQIPGKDAAFEPRFFGMTEEGAGLRVLVCEILTSKPSGPGERADFGTMLSYALVTPGRTAQIICAWARAAARREAAAKPAVNMFGHGVEGQPYADRFELRPDGRCFGLHHAGAGIPPGRFDEMRTVKMLTDALMRAGL